MSIVVRRVELLSDIYRKEDSKLQNRRWRLNYYHRECQERFDGGRGKDQR